MEKGLSEPLISVPFQMDREMFPLRRPMADELAVLCCRGCRKMGNPCIDPPYCIGDICTINRDFIPNEEILCNILLYPFTILNLLFNGPSMIVHLPNLSRRLLDCLTETGKGKREENKENEHKHNSY
jgi:hypothetical protein